MAISLPRQWNVSLWVLTVIGVGMAVIPLVGIGYLLLNPPPDPFGMPTPAVGELLGESGLWALLRNSLALATIVASLSVLIGGWLAWVENRYEHWCQPALLRLCLLPLANPSYISAATLVSAFGPQGWIGSWLSLDKPEGFLAATVSLTLTCTPLTQLTLRAALSRTSVAEEEAARSLGASALKRFKVALWPQLRPAIAFSGLISFLYTISDFGAVATLNLPVLTWRLYESVRTQDLARAALLGAFTLMATVPVLIAAQRIRGSDAAAPLRNRRAARKQALPLRLLFPTLTLQLLVIGIGLIIPFQELSSWVLDGMQREQSFVSQWVAFKRQPLAGLRRRPADHPVGAGTSMALDTSHGLTLQRYSTVNLHCQRLTRRAVGLWPDVRGLDDQQKNRWLWTDAQQWSAAVGGLCHTLLGRGLWSDSGLAAPIPHRPCRDRSQPKSLSGRVATVKLAASSATGTGHKSADFSPGNSQRTAHHVAARWRNRKADTGLSDLGPIQ